MPQTKQIWKSKHRRADGTFQHRPQQGQSWPITSTNCNTLHFFGGKCTHSNDMRVLSATNAHPALYRCTLQRKHLLVLVCLSQSHSPSFFFEMTNIVATHCGCSHVADEPKQLVSCLRNTNGTIRLLWLALQYDSRGKFLSNTGEAAKHS